MDGYIQISLIEMLNELGEDRVKTILSSFSCPLNLDVEDFIRKKAIEFAKQNIAPTHLVFTSYKGKMQLIGYYTLTMKAFCVSNGALSNNVRKKINKFGTYDLDFKGYRIPAPLIAQLSKNFTNGYNKLISGDELLKLACDKIQVLQQVIGGKVVYIECEDKDKLTSFYSSNGFYNFGKRMLDKDETDKLYGEYLIQMLKYIK